ncbi:DUF3429 domain-containing protein [Sphingomonas sp.]|uniref:DUF3429 domain-containing protein n=1 Tax=Sphingomonas sp. TaxID=28214 RepID=UPI002ED9C67C
MSGPGRVGGVARALGFAGLLPQLAAVVAVAFGTDYRLGEALAFVYGALILSFIGGIWWGLAMRRSVGQARLAPVSVAPSLVALAIGIAQVVRGTLDQALIVLGIAILLTPLVDRHLVHSGDAPDGWLRLRLPLSLGLGVLTILAGAL